MKKFICFIIILCMSHVLIAQNKTKNNISVNAEKAPFIKQKSTSNNLIKRKENQPLSLKKSFTDNSAYQKSINGMWDVQFKRDVEIGSGVETNGYFFYVSQWNSDTIYTYNLNGTFFSKFNISVTGIRDMAFDGTYFYGSNATNKIYKMDFTNQLVIDSIICPAYVNVRHIAYDNTNNAFWVGDWDTDIYLVNYSGQVINTISANDHELFGMYGTAYDNFTQGGPYLWVFDQGGWSGCDIVMIHIPTGKQTGIIHNCTDDVASDLMDPIGGGLFVKQNLIQGTVTLGGIIQRQRIFGYDLSTLVANNDVGVEDVLNPILYSGCNLSSSEAISIRIRNYGLNSASNFTVHMNLNNVNYSVNISQTLNRFQTLDVTFPGTFNFSQPLVYKMKFNTSYSLDQNNANDTGYYYLITGNGLITVDLLTDDYPEETYWELYNNFTYDLYGSSSSIYLEPNTYYTTDLCVDTNMCYGYTIFDAYGDGIFNPAYYEIFFNGISVVHDDDFTGLFEEAPYIGHCDYADVGVVGVIDPVSECYLSDEEFVTVIVKNFGTQTVDNATIYYELNGIIYQENLPFSIDSQEEATYSFVSLCDLSDFVTYDFKIYTGLNTDMNPFNDTLFHKTENYFPSGMPYEVSFDNEVVNAQLLVEDENMDYFSWALYNSGGINNSNCAIYSFNPNEPANDWLFSKCIEFLAGNQYVLNFYCKSQSPSYPEKLKVHICEAPSSAAAFTQPLVNLNNITDTAYNLVSVPFNVDDIGSGYYYLGFNVYSDLGAWNLYLDDVIITGPSSVDNINQIKPDFSIYPNPANDILNIEVLNPFNNKAAFYKVSVFNLQGMLLYSEILDGYKSVINIENLSKGMYMIKIEGERELFVRKFIKN